MFSVLVENWCSFVFVSVRKKPCQALGPDEDREQDMVNYDRITKNFLKDGAY